VGTVLPAGLVPVVALLAVFFTLRVGQTIVALLLMGYSFLTQLFPALVMSLRRHNPLTSTGVFAGIVVGVATVEGTCVLSVTSWAYGMCSKARRIEATLRFNVQLTSGETGAHLWSDRFDEEISELAAGQEHIVTRMRSELGIGMVEIEKARSLRERPTNPDAFDLILWARALENQPPNIQRITQ
jgi:hypothetical protein